MAQRTAEQERLKAEITAAQVRSETIQRELRALSGQMVADRQNLEQRQAELAKFQEEYEEVVARLALQSIAATDLFAQQDHISLQLVTKQQELERTIDNKLVELKGLKDQLDLLGNHDFYIPNRDILKLKVLLEDKGIACQTGSQWLKSLSLGEDALNAALQANPLLPYALIVLSERDIKRLGELSLPKELLLNSPVPLLIRPALESDHHLGDGSVLLQEGSAWYLWHKGYSYACSQASLTQLAAELREQLERETVILEDRKARLTKVNDTMRVLEQFLRSYDGGSGASLTAKVDKAKQALTATRSAQQELEQEQAGAAVKLSTLQDDLSRSKAAQGEVSEKLKDWQKWQQDYPLYQKALTERQTNVARLRELEKNIVSLEQERSELESRHLMLGQQQTGLEHEITGLSQRLSQVPMPGDPVAVVKDCSLEQAELDLKLIEDKIRGINASLDSYDTLIRKNQQSIDDYTSRIEQDLKLTLQSVASAEVRFTDSQLAELELAAAALEEEVDQVKESKHKLDISVSRLESTLKAKEDEITGKYGKPPGLNLGKVSGQQLDMEIKDARKQLAEWQGLSQEYTDNKAQLQQAIAGLNTHLQTYEPLESEEILSRAEWEGYRRNPTAMVDVLGKQLKLAQGQVNMQKEATAKAWKTFAVAVKNQANNILDKILMHLLAQESVQFDYAAIYPSFNKLFATIEEYTAKAQYELETCHQNREILRDRCITQAERVAEQLKSVDRYVRVNYAGREVNAVRIKLKDWEAEQAKAIMESYINVCVADLEKMGQRGESEEKQLKYITDQMSSRQLLHTLANLDLCAVEVLKPEQHPTSPRYSKWEEVQKWSGGEQFAGYTAMFMAILSYTRSQETSERNDEICYFGVLQARYFTAKHMGLL